MKQSKFVVVFGVLLLGFTISSFAQVVTLPEITVRAVNYKYLKATNNKETPVMVKRLEREAAVFDVKSAEFYEDEYDNYFISFFIPDGTILAAYDKNGKLLRTTEKYKNVAVPATIRETIAKRYPQWSITKDVYLVTYHDTGKTTKKYKILLEKGDKRMRLKMDDKGTIL